jgi:hypothetical protein
MSLKIKMEIKQEVNKTNTQSKFWGLIIIISIIIIIIIIIIIRIMLHFLPIHCLSLNVQNSICY